MQTDLPTSSTRCVENNAGCNTANLHNRPSVIASSGSRFGAREAAHKAPLSSSTSPFVCPLVGATRLLASQRPSTSGANEAYSDSFKPAGGSKWASRPATSPARESRSLDKPAPKVHETLVGHCRLVSQFHLEALASGDGEPSAFVTAVALDLLANMTPPSAPQRPLLQELCSYIEASVYIGDAAPPHGLDANKQRPRTTIPRRYDGWVPYFLVDRRQRSRATELEDSIRSLQGVVHRSERLQKLKTHLTAMHGIGLSICRSFFSLATMTVNDAALVWYFGFWKVLSAEQRLASRRNAEIMAQTLVEETIQPFKGWQAYVIEKRIAVQEATKQAFELEKHMLNIELKDLEEKREEVSGLLKMSQEETEQLRSHLAVEVARREALSNRLSQARPELTKSALCSVLNCVFNWVLEEALLTSLICKQSLGSRDVAVLLGHDEEQVSKLAKLSAELLLGRWVNYHLMQFKLFASEVLEAVGRLRGDDGPGGDPGQGRLPSEWSSRDVETYCNRCRVVRGLQRISSISEELRDGAVLGVLHAAVSASLGQALTPASLFLLDERDPKVRASKVTEALRLLLPTKAMKHFLLPEDIAFGNTKVLTMTLAALFLHRSCLPSSLPDAKALEFVTVTEMGISRDNGDAKLPNLVAGTCTDISLGTQGEESTPELSRQLLNIALQEVISCVERAAGSCAYGALQDYTQLLLPHEVPADLMRLRPEELLLRWMNRMLQRGKDKETVSVQGWAELKGGHVLFQLLQRIAGDTVEMFFESRNASEVKKAISEQLVVEAVVVCGSRCTPFPIITQESLVEGQADIFAAFVAGLFVCRPGLGAAPKSSLRRHLTCITEAVNNSGAQGDLATRCIWLQKCKLDVAMAIQAVQAARELQVQVDHRLRNFTLEVFAHRSRGVPYSFSGPAEFDKPVEATRLQVMQIHRIEAILNRERAAFPESTAYLSRDYSALEEILRKQLPMLKQMFRHYAFGSVVALQQQQPSTLFPARRHGSVAPPALFGGDTDSVDVEAKVATVDLRGLTRMYKDCQLRKLRLIPLDIEDIYNRVKQEDSALAVDTADGLTLEGFVEVVLALGCKVSAMGEPGSNFLERFAHFVEKRLLSYGSGRSSGLFDSFAYDAGTNRLIARNEKMLRAVFSTYGASSSSNTRSPQSPSEPNSEGHLTCSIELSSLVRMLGHAGLLGKALDEGCVRRILHGVTEGNAADDGGDDLSSDSNSSDGRLEEGQVSDIADAKHASRPNDGAPRFRPLAFQEFVNVLVAVVLHIDPNPFLPFLVRFERFLIEDLFAPLRVFWLQASHEVGLGPTLERGMRSSTKEHRC